MDPSLVKLALGGVALLGCIGLFFGIGLALAAHKFAVEVNPLVQEVLESLAGAQCGGCGYPGCVPGLEEDETTNAGAKEGESIPLTARITAVADVYDALCSRRSYKDPIAEEEAYRIIRESSGTHFDPEVVTAFFQVTDVLKAIRLKFEDLPKTQNTDHPPL